MFPKHSHRICSNFTITEATKGGKSSLQQFPEKTSSTKKYKGK